MGGVLRLDQRPPGRCAACRRWSRTCTRGVDQAAVADLGGALGGEPPSRPALLAAILGEFHRLFETYAVAGFPALRGAWEQRNAFADLPVAIRGESTTLCGTCAGVDDDGALLLRTGDGVQRVLAGDVSLRPLIHRAR